MNIILILIVFGIFIFIVLLGLYIFSSLNNKDVKLVINKFIELSDELNPIIFKGINIRYWTISGSKIYIFPNNYCNLYLFENCLVIARKHNFIFKILFIPILITYDVNAIDKRFSMLCCYKPDSIYFKQVIKGELAIKIRDPENRQLKIDITLRRFSNEQIKALEKIEDWHL